MKKLVKEDLGDILKGKTKEDVIPGEDLVVFKATDPEKSSGTSLSGEVTTSYKRLVKLFGKPEDYTQDGYKVAFTWVVEDDKGRVGTIYDWKVTNMYDPSGITPAALKKLTSYDWHIGSSEGGYTPSWIGDMMRDQGDDPPNSLQPSLVRDLVNFIYFYES